MNEPARSIQQWTQIVRGEYLEIPGLRLTRAQIQRLWDLDTEVCGSVLDTLLRERFLVLTGDRHYVVNRRRKAAARIGPFDKELAVCS